MGSNPRPLAEASKAACRKRQFFSQQVELKHIQGIPRMDLVEKKDRYPDRPGDRFRALIVCQFIRPRFIPGEKSVDQIAHPRLIQNQTMSIPIIKTKSIKLLSTHPLVIWPIKNIIPLGTIMMMSATPHQISLER